MLTAYFDEAVGGGMTVVCGWISDINGWELFEIDWRLFLIKYDVPYFHMKEFSQSVGPFKKWENSETRRKQFLEDAWDIIKSRVHRGFVCVVHEVLFDRVDRMYRLRQAFSTPYALAGREAMDWSNRYAAHDEVKCIFEDGGPGKGGLMRAADVAPIRETPGFNPSRNIQDRKRGLRKGLCQLQSADFLAYEIRKYIVDHPLIRSGQRIPRIPLQKFAEKRPDTKFMNELRMLRVCQSFGIKHRSKNA